MNFRGTVAVIAGMLAWTANGQDGVPDLIFHGGRPQGDPRIGGMAWSGSAVPSGALSVFANPALAQAYGADGKIKGLLTGISYGQSAPMYDGHVVTFGGGYYSPVQGTVLNMYRYLAGAEGTQTDYQTILTYARRMSDRDGKKGPVDVGINVRYEQSNWDTRGLPTLYSYRKGPSDSAWTVYDTVVAPRGSILDKRIIADIGAFQSNAFDNLDFSIVVHNVAGYRWAERRPQETDSISISGFGDTLIQRTYDNTYAAQDDWIDGWYRRVTLGVAFHSMVLKNKVKVTVPLDLEVYGLLHRGRDNHTLFRCGIEALVKHHFALRFGYGRQPRYVPEHIAKIENENVFSIGAGFSIKGIVADGFYNGDEWGVGVSFSY